MRRHTLLICFILMSAIIDARQIEQYAIFELELKGPSAGNPFTGVQLSAEFRLHNRSLYCDGFYDGDGIYRVRFMPDKKQH
ncbi:MAG: alpha-L-rhamnosidase [Bacteroidetes bacterium]|nr:alpha-L-rhamnosidase [Bacteroidota bacterium]